MACATGAIIVTVFVAVLEHPPIVTEYVILDVPADTPVTRPVPAFTAATPGIPLYQVPPLLVLAQGAVDPIHKGVCPVIVCDVGIFTVTVRVAVFTQTPPVVTE